MTLSISQTGTFSGGGNPSATVTPSAGSPKSIIVGYAAGGGATSMTYGGVTLTGLVTAYGGISKVDVAMAYMLDISLRATDTLQVNNGNNGNGSVVFYAFVEGFDPVLLSKNAYQTGGTNSSATSASPTIAGANIVGLMSKCSYNNQPTVGSGMTNIYTGNPSRVSHGASRAGAIDSTLQLHCVNAAPTGSWGAFAYLFLEENSVPVPRPSQAIVIAS